MFFPVIFSLLHRAKKKTLLQCMYFSCSFTIWETAWKLQKDVAGNDNMESTWCAVPSTSQCFTQLSAWYICWNQQEIRSSHENGGKPLFPSIVRQAIPAPPRISVHTRFGMGRSKQKTTDSLRFLRDSHFPYLIAVISSVIPFLHSLHGEFLFDDG